MLVDAVVSSKYDTLLARAFVLVRRNEILLPDVASATALGSKFLVEKTRVLYHLILFIYKTFDNEYIMERLTSTL